MEILKAKNYAVLGEAGCGKSELAINLALALSAPGERPVHFFDLDMTKPLFRSRDVASELERTGVTVHFQEQFMDAPTLVGGAAPLLRAETCCTVLDIGGDYIGARSVGGLAPLLNSPSTVVLYVINVFRPWSDTIRHIDETMSKILSVSHVRPDKLCLVANPNNGATTTLEDIVSGFQLTNELVCPYLSLSFACVREELAEQAAKKLPVPVFPLHLALTYPWIA